MSFSRKLVGDEISLISDGSAFQARGLAMEKALLHELHDSEYGKVAAPIGPHSAH